MKQFVAFIVSILLLTSTPAYGKANSPLHYPLWAADQQQQTKPQAKPQATKPKLSVVPNNVPIKYINKILTAELALSRSQPELALANYIWVAKETQDVRIAKRATQIAMAMGSLPFAEEASLIWAKAGPKDLEAQITVGAILIRAGKPQESVPYLNKVQQLTPLDANQHFIILYKQLREDKDRKNVIKALEGVAKFNPKHYSAPLALGEIYLFLGDHKKALMMSQKALNINPDVHIAIILHAQALITNNQNKQAVSFLEQKINLHKDNIPLKLYYVEFLFNQGQGDKAKAEIKNLVNIEGLQAQQLLNLARLSMEAGWHQESEGFLMKAAEDKNYKHTAFYFLARLYELKKQTDKSIEWYQKVGSGPFHIISYVRASMLLSDMDKSEKALNLLGKAQPATKDDLKQLLITQTEILSKAKRYEEALAALTSQLKVIPNDVDFLYSRALIAEKVGKIDITEQDLKAILKQQPKHIDALNALGYILTTNTKRYDEAHKYLSKALQLAPNNASILDSMGWLEFKMGKHADAIKNLKKALSLLPNPEIAAHLGEVLWDLNQHEEAKKVWAEALKTNPNHPSVINTRDRFIGNAKVSP